MKRKFLLLFLMCILMGGVSSLFAQDVTIGSGTTESYEMPFETYRVQSGSQTYYLSDSIGKAKGGTIDKIAYYISTSESAGDRKIKVYLRNTEESSFPRTSGRYYMVNMTKEECVFDGSINTNTTGWVTIDINDFKYNGQNLLVAVYDYTNKTEKLDTKFYTYTSGNSSSYRTIKKNSALANPEQTSTVSFTGDTKSPNIKLTFLQSTDEPEEDEEPKTIEVDVEEINLGDVVVSGCWSEKHATATITATNTTISSITCDEDFFNLEYNLEENPVVLKVSAKNTYSINAKKEGTISIKADGATTKQITVSANAYMPEVIGDVWERPIDITFDEKGKYSDSTTYSVFDKMHDNYILPYEVDGKAKDVVYRFTLDKEQKVKLNVSNGYTQRFALYKSTDINNGPSSTNAHKSNLILSSTPQEYTWKQGTYYLVIASEKPYYLNIEKSDLPLPGEVTGISPVNNSLWNEYYFGWEFGANTSEYQVKMGTDKNNLDIMVVDWTATTNYKGWQDFPNNFYLENSTRYYWQVNVKNSTGVTTGAINSFYTTLEIPTRIIISNDNNNIYPDKDLVVTWSGSENAAGYNVFVDYHGKNEYKQINETLIEDTKYSIPVENLEYNITEGHNIKITAVYDFRNGEDDEFSILESNPSNPVNIKVTGYGMLNAKVTDINGNGIEGATIKFDGKDEFGNTISFSFATAENGIMSSNKVLAGNYQVTVSKDLYVTKTIKENILVKYNEQAEDIEVSLESLSTFKNDGEWTNENNWDALPEEHTNTVIKANAVIMQNVTVKSIDIEEGATLTVKSGVVLNVTNGIINNNVAALVMEDGAQIIQPNSNVAATFNMNIVNPSEEQLGWQFIASPFTKASIENFIVTGGEYSYDLFKYDGTANAEWNNQKDGGFDESFVNGRGYLASYETETTATFTGILNNATSFNYEVAYNAEKDLANFHLLGNPFTFNMDWSKATAKGLVDGYAVVNNEGGYDYLTLTSGTINVGDGFFVKANAENPSLTYDHSYVAPVLRGSEKANSINVIATGKAGKDNVIVKFAGQAEGFNKLQNFNDAIATVYVSENGKNYGIANVDENTTEVALNFDAKEMGNYTISFDLNGEFETVTLVDRLTGTETDMLVENEYSFIASADDNVNRFVIRLAQGSQLEAQSQFVYQSGEELILSIEGSVQIVDMLGRVVYSNEHADAYNRINVAEFKDATYVVRVVNEEGVKVQKVVIY